MMRLTFVTKKVISSVLTENMLYSRVAYKAVQSFFTSMDKIPIFVHSN